MLNRIRDGRTDLVFDYLAAGHPAGSRDAAGVALFSGAPITAPRRWSKSS
ncbi:MAG: hypothetical protein LC796_09765 [Acidobacteria bacterium]|nr:hypothetical protein [Acidobacteriota bacterium]